MNRKINFHGRRLPRLNDAGVTLVELLIAVAIMAVMAASLISVRMFMAKQTLRIKDQAFAGQKALQIMEELRSVVNEKEQASIIALDDYNDGDPGNGDARNRVSPVLTSNKGVTDPGNPLSGNVSFGPDWKYVRNIEVAPDPNGNTYGRYVRVRIYYRSDVNGSSTPKPLVELGSLLRSSIDEHVPTQVYDVYVLALNNVPGWWSVASQMRSLFNQITTSIQNRNPGVNLRVHYITKTAYGRDPEYAPYVNVSSNLGSTAPPYVYFYPGLVTSDYGPVSYVDVNNLALNATGGTTMANTEMAQISSDYGGTTKIYNQISYKPVPGTSWISSFPGYAACDQFNHAMRYPDEVRAYTAACTFAAYYGYAKPEPSLRMLVEAMANPTTADQYKNILLLNLHGELFPMPALRNYSDAAKLPDGAQTLVSGASFPATLAAGAVIYNSGSVSLRYMRLVTHPEQLEYAVGSTNATEPVTLRVYPYVAPLNNTTAAACPVTAQIPVSSVYLPNDYVDPSDGSFFIEKVDGCGKDASIGVGGTPYTRHVATNGENYVVTHPNGTDTLITLFNTPVRHQQTW